MISTLTFQLLALLLGASVLGMLIGSSMMRIHLHRKNNSDNTASGKKTDSSVDKAGEAEGNALDNRNAGMSEDERAQLTAQQETLQAHANLQAQRLDKLTSELHASEEKCIRLQRDFASFKANKMRELEMLKVSSDEWLDNDELPVLNKKVDQITAHSAAVEPLESDELQAGFDGYQPIVSNELDIPALAEIELPETVEELEFVLVDDNEQT